ncbi:serine/threonine protein kinase [Nannocystis exedens]|nr:serine/threonine protein kinase [Nannocystis exedens]
MDPQQEHTWPNLERLGSDKRDLADEAMYRSLKSKLFDEAHPPVQLGRFRVVQTLGQGGMGVVYSAQDLQLDRLVAIKVIRDDRLREGARDRARLLREAQMQAKLSHPNVVQIHEVSEAEGGLFIVMELVKGFTLREWLDREARPLAAILERFVEAARGLSAAHQVGIVHRDFKLANALVGEDGRVRIADFGLAVADQRHQETEPDRPAGPASGHTSKYAGTPTYMSPEQVRGRECDARSDQYSFAVALTEAVFRRAPPPAVERLADRTGAPLALPADPPAPQWLRRALTRALSLDPADRFPTMADLIDVLVESPKRRRRRALAAGLVVALTSATALGATLFTASAQTQCSQYKDRLASTWNERKQTLHDAFKATGVPYAEKSWQRASSMLAEYVHDWAEVAANNCQATQPATPTLERLFARGAACLDRQRSAFDTLLDQFAKADAALVADADAAVAGLPPPARCRVSADMRLEGAPVGPTTPRVRELLDRGELLTNIQKGRDAVAVLDDALSESRGTADAAGEAEALLCLGRARGRLLGDGPGATYFLHQAYDRANAADHPSLKWEIWNELAWVQAVVFDAPGEARTSMDHARSEPHPDPRTAEAAIAAVEGEILIAEGRAEEAVERRKFALATLRALYPADHPEVVLARRALAAGLGEARQQQLARELNEQLLADLRRDYEPSHPWPARVELDLGLDLYELEQYPAAREHFERARDTLLAAYGERHPWVAKAEVALARLDVEGGAIPQAIERLDRALATFDDLYPPAHAERINALIILADAHLTSGQTARALTVYRELLAIHEAAPAHSTVDEPGVVANIGDALCTLGRCPEALPYFASLLAHESTASDPALKAAALRGFGLVHLAKGQPELAVAPLQEALRLFEQAPGDRSGIPAMRVATMRELADALTATGRSPEKVRELRRRAAELESAG